MGVKHFYVTEISLWRWSIRPRFYIKQLLSFSESSQEFDVLLLGEVLINIEKNFYMIIYSQARGAKIDNWSNLNFLLFLSSKKRENNTKGENQSHRVIDLVMFFPIPLLLFLLKYQNLVKNFNNKSWKMFMWSSYKFLQHFLVQSDVNFFESVKFHIVQIWSILFTLSLLEEWKNFVKFT